MNEKILFVDDEPKVLAAYQRQLRKYFNIDLAFGGEEAVSIVEKQKPYAVIISDMRMPGMDGIQFLSLMKEKFPDTVRIMLTGNADQDTAINAVNEGNIFRFLTKPCPPDLFIKTINAAIRQYQLVTSERELLEKTLSSSIKVMTEILSLTNPAAFSQAVRIKRYVKQIVEQLQLPNRWQFELAAMLSQIGCVTLPIDTMNKIYSGTSLSKEEAELYENHPEVGRRLLANIPRLELVAQMIAAQHQSNGYQFSGDYSTGEDLIAVGGSIIKVTLEFDRLRHRGVSVKKTLEQLKKQFGNLSYEIINILSNLEIAKSGYVVKSIYLKELRNNMIVDEDIIAVNGTLLVSKGQEVTFTVIERIRSFSRWSKVKEPFRVIIPASTITNNEGKSEDSNV